MTDITTPTDEVVDQSSSDIRDESLLDTDNEQDSAVERQEDTDSSDNDSQDSDSEHSSSHEDSSNEDKGLAKFAKSQGFDPTNLTDGEKRALKLAYDNQKAFRNKKNEEANQSKVDDEVSDLYKPDADDGTTEIAMKRLAVLEARDFTRSFWDKNPDDREYEPYMVQALQEEKANFGDDAARALAANLPRLLREAKYIAGANDSDVARDAGRKEEREKLRKIQEGAADTAHASTSASAPTKRLTREEIDNMSVEEYASRRGEIDEAISRGDLY